MYSSTFESTINFISNRIKSLREAKKVSAHAMSLDLGQNRAYINKIENKVSKPSIEGLYNICEYFNISLQEFFNENIKRPDMINELLAVSKNLEYEQLQILIDMANQLRKNK